MVQILLGASVVGDEMLFGCFPPSSIVAPVLITQVAEGSEEGALQKHEATADCRRLPLVLSSGEAAPRDEVGVVFQLISISSDPMGEAPDEDEATTIMGRLI